ncbi:hypothetical protein TNCV_3546681 [Trichonephila clavipes]|nr:hypothetical protein TNCV_3546681 [Trichonephila clavipes]
MSSFDIRGVKQKKRDCHKSAFGVTIAGNSSEKKPNERKTNSRSWVIVSLEHGRQRSTSSRDGYSRLRDLGTPFLQSRSGYLKLLSTTQGSFERSSVCYRHGRSQWVQK